MTERPISRPTLTLQRAAPDVPAEQDPAPETNADEVVEQLRDTRPEDPGEVDRGEVRENRRDASKWGTRLNVRLGLWRRVKEVAEPHNPHLFALSAIAARTRNEERRIKAGGEVQTATYVLPAGLAEAVAKAADAAGMESPSEWAAAVLAEAVDRAAMSLHREAGD